MHYITELQMCLTASQRHKGENEWNVALRSWKWSLPSFSLISNNFSSLCRILANCMSWQYLVTKIVGILDIVLNLKQFNNIIGEKVRWSPTADSRSLWIQLSKLGLSFCKKSGYFVTWSSFAILHSFKCFCKDFKVDKV